METTNPTDNNYMLNPISATMFATALVCRGLVIHFSVGDVYDALFKTLSVLSVFMIIVINYPKFKERVKKIIGNAKPKQRRSK